MAWWRRYPFEPTDEGDFLVHLRRSERMVVAKAVERTRESLLSPSDPMLARLFPTAHPDDPEKQAEWEALARDRLLESRFQDFDVIEATVDAELLTEEELQAWSTGVNAIRLVLGTALDVQEDLDEVDEDDPHVAEYALYDYLSGLVAGAARALSTTLPEPTRE